MKKILSTSLVLSLFALPLVFAPSAKAEVIEQRQLLRNEFSVECTNGTCKVSGNQSGEQHQNSGGRASSTTSNWSWSDWDDDSNWNEDEDDSGEVRLGWNQRGGTCHVRYKETTSRTYNYSTQAACDDGGITIGGLVPDRAYHFQIKKDNGRWSRARRIVAE